MFLDCVFCFCLDMQLQFCSHMYANVVTNDYKVISADIEDKLLILGPTCTMFIQNLVYCCLPIVLLQHFNHHYYCYFKDTRVRFVFIKFDYFDCKINHVVTVYLNVEFSKLYLLFGFLALQMHRYDKK